MSRAGDSLGHPRRIWEGLARDILTNCFIVYNIQIIKIVSCCIARDLNLTLKDINDSGNRLTVGIYFSRPIFGLRLHSHPMIHLSDAKTSTRSPPIPP